MHTSTWICTYQMQTTKFMSLLPLLVCFSCLRIFDPLTFFTFFNVTPSLSIFMSKSNFPQYLCTNLSSFVINFHKRCASLDTKGCNRDRWLTLESCIFYGHHLICWNDTICIALEIPHIWSLTLIPIGGTPPPMS